ncbi:MAG: UDP-glucose 4-epimerase GalE [Candidatus Methanomethylophilaceae archaeon]
MNECRASKRKILVAGGAGYIGSHTVKELVKRGYEVTVLDNLSNGHMTSLEGVKYVNGDIGDYDKVNKLLQSKEIDAVIHFAALAYVGESVSNPRKYYDNNVVKGKAFLDAVVDSGVKKIVFSSSCATYGIPEEIPISEDEKQWPVNPYGWTKLMFEQMMKDYDEAYDLRYISLRYFNAAGADADGSIGETHNPETHVIPILLQNILGIRKKFSVFGTDYDTRDGSCIRDYIHVTDLADAHIKAIEYLFEKNESDYFNLGSGEGISVLELIRVVERITGKRLNVVFEDRRPGDPDILIADNSKAKVALGWNPVHSSIDNIVRTAWGWHTRDDSDPIKESKFVHKPI